MEVDVAGRMTMTQLAQLAEVDVSTVSRALRGDTRRVSPATVVRIQELAESVGFRPDANASSLRSGRSHVIGMMVPDLTDPVLASLFEAVRLAAAEAGYSALVTSTNGDPGLRAAAVDDYRARRIDGVILTDSPMKNPLPERLAESGKPFVMALRGDPHSPSVVADDVHGGGLAAEHLLERGHHEFLVVAGPRGIRSAVNRLSGFRRALRRAGVELPVAAINHGGFGVADGYRSMRQLLETTSRPTAVFAVDDLNAIGAARALREAGLSVGADVALVGYNDIALSSYMETPLTSIRVDYQALGREAVALLLAGIKGESRESVTLPTTLVVRQSSTHGA